MQRNVVTIDRSTSCHEAAARMAQRRMRHLPVVGPSGALVGVVTDRDLRHRLLGPVASGEVDHVSLEDILKATAVEDVMSTPAVTAAPEDDLGAAARTMHQRKIGSLPVVEAGRVVGIMTETDLLREILRATECCCREVAEIVVPFP
jgi:CBS domain-containing protein